MATLTLTYDEYSMKTIIREVRKVHPQMVIRDYRFHPNDLVSQSFWLYRDLNHLKDRMNIGSRTTCGLVNYGNPYREETFADIINYDDYYIFGLDDVETKEILTFIQEETKRICLEEYRENRRERREALFHSLELCSNEMGQSLRFGAEEQRQRREEKLDERRAKRAKWRQRLEEESSDDISEEDVSDSSEEVVKG